MKKLYVLLALVMLLAMGVPAAAANESVEAEISYREIRILINGEAITPCDANGTPVEPFILDGSTYLPVRAVADALGLQVEWDAGTSTVRLTSGAAPGVAGGTPALSSGTKRVLLSYRDIRISLDGRLLTLCDADGSPVEPFILDGSTYLPVRAVADALGLQVEWDAGTSTIRLGAPPALRDGMTELCIMESTVEYVDSAAPVSCSVSYDYTASGALLKSASLSGNGKTTAEYSYAADGSLEKISYSGAQNYTVSYTYGEHGPVRILTAGDQTRSETFLYNSWGLLSQAISDDGAIRETSVYTYDEAGLLSEKTVTTVTDASEYVSTTAYTYDRDGNLLKSVTRDSDGYESTSEYEYDDGGRLMKQSTLEIWGTRSELVYEYGEDGLLLRQAVYHDGSLDHSVSYEYNANGHVIKATETGAFYRRVTTYDYELFVIDR